MTDTRSLKLPELSALDLEKHVSVQEAAEIRGISRDTFKRHYAHLIRKLSPRREGVRLRDLLSEQRATLLRSKKRSAFWRRPLSFSGPSRQLELPATEGIEVVSLTVSPPQTQEYAFHHKMQTLRRRSVSAVLARNPDGKVRQLLKLRRDGARASVAKLAALFAHAGADNRIRGALKYHGASTGRWAGAGFQPHNLKRIEIENFDTDAAIDAVLTRDRNRVGKFGPPMTVIGDTARGLICAPQGHTLVCGDFSTIEARVLCWYAGEEWKLDGFRRYDATNDPALDPYLNSAARILKRRVDQADDISRHLGKTCELAFGFGGGLGAWRNFDSSDNHSDADVERFKQEWRRAHPATTRFWHRLEGNVKKVIRTGQRGTLGNLAFEFADQTLYLTLPSGRKLVYPQAHRVPGKFDGATDVAFFENARGGWAETRAWFGIFVENVVSATARDLLAAALLRIDAAGFPICLHVHDEICREVPEDFRDAEAFRRLMVELPGWAAGLPIAARVRIGKRYSKSKPQADTQVREIQTLDLNLEEREFVDDF